MDIQNPDYVERINGDPASVNRRIFGISIDFEFTDSTSPDKSFEVNEELQKNTLEFLNTMKTFITKIDKPLLLMPSEPRRYKAYKRFLRNIESPEIYLIG
jgi:hypothetical protein